MDPPLVSDLYDVLHYGNLCPRKSHGKDLVGTNVNSTKVIFDADPNRLPDPAEELLCQERLPAFLLADPVEGITKCVLKTRLDGIAEQDVGDPTHKKAELSGHPSDPNEGELIQIFIKSLTG